MPGKASARVLLRMAQKDFRAARILAESGDDDPEIIGFHLQQSAEKALKAWLLCVDGEPERTHDLSFLLSRLEQHGMDVRKFESLVELNPFAVQFRYGLWMEDEPFDWNASSQPVSALLEQVQGALDAAN